MQLWAVNHTAIVPERGHAAGTEADVFEQLCSDAEGLWGGKVYGAATEAHFMCTHPLGTICFTHSSTDTGACHDGGSENWFSPYAAGG